VRPVEALFLLDGRGAVLWADRSGSAAAIPDSRARWDAIWARRGELSEIAHTHPVGPAAFSLEDLTTMAALDSALGRPLTYSIVTNDAVLRKLADGTELIDHNEPWWVPVLRHHSGMEASSAEADRR